MAICGDVQVARLAQRLGLEPDEPGATIVLLAEPPGIIEQIGKSAAGALHILLPHQIFGIGLPRLQERQRRVDARAALMTERRTLDGVAEFLPRLLVFVKRFTAGRRARADRSRSR